MATSERASEIRDAARLGYLLGDDRSILTQKASPTMARAGYCEICQRYVYLNDQWGCQNGHPWTAIRAWYDPDTGQPITPYWLEPGYVAATDVDAVAPDATTSDVVEDASAGAEPAAADPSAEPPIVVPVGAGLPVAEPDAPAPEIAASEDSVPVGQGFPEPEPEAPAPAVSVPEDADVPVEQGLPEPEAPAVAPAIAPSAPVPATRLDLLARILDTMARYPGYRAHYGTDTDIVIDNEVTDAAWPGGRKTVDYSAMMKAVEAERTLYFWEMLTERSSGLSFGSAGSETYTLSGNARSGKTKIVILGTDGQPVSVDWDFADTRRIVESVVAQSGWKLDVVLRQASAKW